MQRSSALVLPSRCMEPAPLVLAEAAYNCLPSIVADHGGLVEFVKDKVNGLHFEAGNRESLKNTLEKVIRNPSLLRVMGREARRVVDKQGLDIDNHLRKLEKYYYDILGI